MKIYALDIFLKDLLMCQLCMRVMASQIQYLKHLIKGCLQLLFELFEIDDVDLIKIFFLFWGFGVIQQTKLCLNLYAEQYEILLLSAQYEKD